MTSQDPCAKEREQLRKALETQQQDLSNRVAEAQAQSMALRDEYHNVVKANPGGDNNMLYWNKMELPAFSRWNGFDLNVLFPLMDKAHACYMQLLNVSNMDCESVKKALRALQASASPKPDAAHPPAGSPPATDTGPQGTSGPATHPKTQPAPPPGGPPPINEDEIGAIDEVIEGSITNPNPGGEEGPPPLPPEILEELVKEDTDAGTDKEQPGVQEGESPEQSGEGQPPYTEQQLMNGQRANMIAQVLKANGNLGDGDPDKLMEKRNQMLVSEEFRNLPREEQFAKERTAMGLVHAAQRLELANAPAQTITMKDQDSTSTQTLYPDGTIYTRIESGSDPNNRQVFENWVKADGTQVSRIQSQAQNQTDSDGTSSRSTFIEETTEVLSPDQKTSQIDSTSVSYDEEAKSLPHPKTGQ